MRKLLLVAICCFVLGGCATYTEPQNTSTATEEPEATVAPNAENNTSISEILSGIWNNSDSENKYTPTLAPTATPKPTPTEAVDLDVYGLMRELELETMGDGRVQYENGIYTVLFGFKNEDRDYVWAEGTVYVNIFDNEKNLLYTRGKDITKSDYGYWSNAITGERYLCSIEIKESDIIKGYSESGTISLSFKGKEIGINIFDDYTFDIDNLPYQQKELEENNELGFVDFKQNGQTFSEYNYHDELQGTARIDAISYEFKESYDGTVNLYVYFTGEIVDGNKSFYLRYKLYDEEDYVVEDGLLSIDRLSKGDKFRNKYVYIDEIDIGNYRIELSDY